MFSRLIYWEVDGEYDSACLLWGYSQLTKKYAVWKSWFFLCFLAFFCVYPVCGNQALYMDKNFFQNLWPWPRYSADLQGEKLSCTGWLWLWTTHILIGISCFRVSVPCSLMVLLQLSFTWNILNPEISKNYILYLIISVYTWSCIVSRETLFSNKKIWYQVDFFGVF